jgi:Zn-dependent peptidase ImmA (M78 family)/DNA-binding XRE family transcriptional regulator
MTEGRFEPSRLILARRRAGLNRTELARGCDLTARTIIAYEHGERAPSGGALSALSTVLGFPVEFFHGEPVERLSSEGVSFRSLKRTVSVQREQALSAGELALIVADFIDARFNLHPPRVPDLHPQPSPGLAAKSLRTWWGLGDAPIPNMVRLLEANGVRVFSLAENTRDIDAFSFWRKGKPFVFLNTLKSPERSRFDAAHELGHLVMHQHGYPAGRVAENDANAFASAFLMPDSSLQRYAPRDAILSDLVHAKQGWGVSVAALAYRMHKLGLLTQWRYDSLCIQMQTQGYRQHEPKSIARELSAVWPAVFGALKEDGISRADLAKGLTMPLDELRGLVFQLVLTADPTAGGGGGFDAFSPPKLRLER